MVFEKLLQVLRFGRSYESIADSSCSASTIRNRRDEWIKLGVFERLKVIVLDAYDRIVGLLLAEIGVTPRRLVVVRSPAGPRSTGC